MRFHAALMVTLLFAGAAFAADAAPITAATAAEYAQQLKSVADQLDKPAPAASVGLGAFLLTAMFWGAVSLATPCVFPMIPITVSFFLKQSEKAHSSPLLLASVYCLTIVGVLGSASLTLLGFFRSLSVSPWMNFALGALFVALALSLFGLYELTLPSFLSRFTDTRARSGGLFGTVFMALTFTIVSFTCVAPFLGGFGGMAASGQFKFYELALGALAYSATFAAPFFFLALFPSLLRKLPKSGGWLNSVKVVMGFLELAAALKFLRAGELILLPQPQFFTYDLVLAAWVALLVVGGLYLVNVFRIGHDEPLESVSVTRLLLGVCWIGLAVYLLPALYAAGHERNRPTGVVYEWVDSFLLPDPHEASAGWSGNLPGALAAARAESQRLGQAKYVFVDFTGKTCTNCKINERSVFSKPEVQALFKQYTLVQLYTDEVPDPLYSPSVGDTFRGATERQQADASTNLDFQSRQFGTSQLPLYAILKPRPDGGIERVGVYTEGKINNEAAFTEFLRKPLGK